ncbi:hypothetical protein NBRC10512_003313 [Rhodotorula toruloides]|uniref:RHTO0S24e00518g1_1 n=2 Tax=Rhodotorula toruloides TaxID=5286 RepID=A0A061BGV2_RHOTO|nr:uncharacterized protein RHTO_04545 [Rhodotorula toruloides NP11]EMS19353.1 hypothetical protein RHTO_04545 [Rhodotorula toruloides NP11]CDR49198.1 RHTO0S24e00518g1_1 [Rhodotorula toruloides]
MPAPSKRPRKHSPPPSPLLLPSHLTTLPSAPLRPSSSSTASGAQVQAWEATLLPSRLQWEVGVDAPEVVVWKGRVSRGEAEQEAEEEEGEEIEVRTDRYDILHLLPSTLSLPSSSSSAPPDPRGFTHLPPLHEDLFFLTPSERALVAHKERRRKVEEEREERVREVERLEREESERVRREGGEDEEPDATQLALMTRLHSTLSSSPNPSLLELRILANHSKDERFAFLREGGRWRSVWGEIRRGERGVDGRRKEGSGQVKADEAKKEGLAGLVGYGSDSEDEEEQEEEAGGRAEPEAEAGAGQAVANLADLDSAPDPPASANTGDTVGDAERRAKQALKAERAREWARKRREARDAAEAASESAPGS